ncbi:MAG: hypothetical protein QOG63_2982, partial [Thermoleophilaceae bacterium]|nr:hypothetical protein [Thermoleophilaceae bacterium]
GDVSYAILSTAIEDSHLADIPGSPALVAIGGRISPAKAVDEVVCVVYGSDAAAKSEADGLRKSLAPGALLPSTRERLSGPVARTTVDTVGAGGQSAARAVLSLKPGTPPSLVISAFYRGDLTALLGGPGRGPVGP